MSPGWGWVGVGVGVWVGVGMVQINSALLILGSKKRSRGVHIPIKARTTMIPNNPSQDNIQYI